MELVAAIGDQQLSLLTANQNDGCDKLRQQQIKLFERPAAMRVQNRIENIWVPHSKAFLCQTPLLWQKLSVVLTNRSL